MTAKTLLNDYAAFNLWANTVTLNWLKTKPMDLLEREVPSSFPSIKATLLHVWGAEKIWLERLKGIPPTTILLDVFRGPTEEIFEGFPLMSAELKAYVQNLSEAELDEECHFRMLNGTEDSRPRAYMIHHCMNHSTYHRGQMVTMARILGITDPPSTDFMRYLRSK